MRGVNPFHRTSSPGDVRYGGATIEFSHLAPGLFTGFETRDGFNLALPEKALLDTIYLRKAIPFGDELELSLLDRKRLDRMAKDFPDRPGSWCKVSASTEPIAGVRFVPVFRRSLPIAHKTTQATTMGPASDGAGLLCLRGHSPSNNLIQHSQIASQNRCKMRS